jgi:hypothetical protein
MKFHSRRVITVFLMTALGVSAAVDDAPLATSTTYSGCGVSSEDKLNYIGPLGVAAQDSCDSSGSTEQGFYVASSDVKTGFGTALPKIGVVDVVVEANANGTDDSKFAKPVTAGAQAGGSVTFYFTVEEIRSPVMNWVPSVYFEAHGQATIEGSATNSAAFNYEGSAGAFVILPDGTQWGIEGEIEDPESPSWSDEFAKRINLELAPNDLDNPFYQVTIAAGCDVQVWTGGDYNSRAECQVAVDPTIRLDQEAFDAKHGSDSFQLSEYYTLEFSENVNAIPFSLTGNVEDPFETPLCAMVLASGQYMFTCSPNGPYALTNLPTEANGTVTRQVYADGFFPRVDVLQESVYETVVMEYSGTCQSYNPPSDPDTRPGSAGERISISGRVLDRDTSTPLCAMVLSNGSYVFSCDGSGSYSLTFPLDANGQYTLQVYADGFAPTIQIFDEFYSGGDVRMARATECR